MTRSRLYYEALAIHFVGRGSDDDAEPTFIEAEELLDIFFDADQGVRVQLQSYPLRWVG